jgi:hypothetical protein
VSSRAWIFGRPRGARSGFRRLDALDYAGCLEREGAGGAQILLAIQDRLAGHESTTESYRGIRVSLGLRQGPLLFDVFVDVLLVREGRALAAIAFTSANAPPDQSFEAATLAKMSARMRHTPA